MVKRLVSFLFLFVFILSLFVFPCFAYDYAQSDSDWFGFSFDNSGIYMFEHSLDGSALSVSNQFITCNKIYFYFPCSVPADSLEYHFSFLSTGGGLVFDSSDYGEVYGSTYHYLGSISGTRTNMIGSTSIEGSSAKFVSFFCRFGADPLPFSGFNSYRYIRLSYDCVNNFTLVNWLNRSVLNPSYTFSGTNTVMYGRTTSGSLSSSGYYITGSIKDKYYNGSSVVNDTRSLNSGTSGSAGYLYVPSHTITFDHNNQFNFTINASGVSGSIVPSDGSTSIDRTYSKVVTVSGTRTYNDKEIIEAIQDASDLNHTDITNFSTRNHSDLQAISSQLGELVQHQEQVNQTGDDIGSTTSDSSISDTSGNLSNGSDGLSSVLSTASDISSVSGAASPYISFIGAAMPIILNFGNGVLAWSVIGIIACSVFLYILKKVAE